MTDFAAARQNMIDGQIRPNKVIDSSLLKAISATPREVFVPQSRQGMAYGDENLAIADDRYLIEPTTFARLVQALELSPDHTVIDIGGMTGYAAAVLARLVAKVVMVESDADLAAQAKENFKKLGLNNIEIHVGSLGAGYQKAAPYDAGFVNGAVAEVADAWIQQISPNGGRLAVVVTQDRQVGRASLGQKNGDNWSVIPLFDAQTPYMAGFAPKPAFQF